MTLRDLTPRQLYNLRRRCEKERKRWWQRPDVAAHTDNIFDAHNKSWNAAFNAGLKAGLEQHPNVISP